MASSSRPGSPATGTPQRPMSAMMRPPRSNSRMSVSSGKQGGPGGDNTNTNTNSSNKSGSRASDEDTKTAVKVAVRVRPPLTPDDPGYELIPQRFQRPVAHATSNTSLTVDTPHGRKLFVFDRVFGETVDQEGVWDYLHDSVTSFMQGYNVSLLAYGQSGAGKSYTMGTSGPREQNDAAAMGIVPRAAQLLFDQLTGGQSHNRSGSSGLRTPTRYSVSSSQSQSSFGRALLDKNWQLKATYVEIYNEQLRDLLLPESTPTQERNPVTIREDTKGRILLTGLQQVNINSFEDLLGALNFGSAIRQTDATAINAKSSRSHAVFSLNLIQRKDPSASSSSASSSGQTSAREKRFSMPVESLSGSEGATVTIDSKLHFVDLAGSERLKNTGASGDRAKEGISINAGLASLGKVISQLSSRQGGAHVSYRDSKLTRLLQDSLGGNAYTYMVACVTPVEFHVNETLNTAQYAQRARAIQSKPQIQQSLDEGDKQAVIDRLKAEISFLRGQLRNTEDGGGGGGGSERRGTAAHDGGEKRQSEREMELQNQLLDVQEGYTALSQRHAKLISELTNATDFNGDPDDLNNIISDSAMERLKRSHSFAESVEQVVLEYEKTIQSLESSLSDTRSSLASTESNLLERETKCAYVETVNTQLQARIQKMMDRETSTETYLHELEAKLDGHSTGEEKNAAIVAELRKEIARARENEASCEDYISTLEERLAEADQDMELMQREMDRLEHVIDRQRSLGKLDNLLYELDHIQQNGTSKGGETDSNMAPTTTSTPPIRELRKQRANRNQSLDVLMEAAETAIPESGDDDDLADPPDSNNAEHPPTDRDAEVVDDSGLEVLEKAAASHRKPEPPAAVVPDEKTEEEGEGEEDHPRPSTGQSRVSPEKLENVTQELADLRVEHESTVNDYSILNTKYEEALRSLAELQDAVDEARHQPTSSVATPVTSSRPVSFLGSGSRVQEIKSGGGQHQSSRSLSSELSSAEESPFSPVTSESTQKTSSALPEHSDKDVSEAGSTAATSNRELETMKKLLQEHQQGMNAVTQQYAQLQSEHEGTLSVVENLKKEVEKSKATAASAAPSSMATATAATEPSPSQKVIRRMTSQNMTSVDRAHRSLASLRNIASEEFDGQPDTMENFEVHLTAAMHELHSRMERIQSLEAENQNVKKEMETKTTIISGLTRERSSLQGSSAIDMSVVSQLRDQIVNYETQMKELQESHDAKEDELKKELLGFNDVLEEYKATVQARDAEIEQQQQTIAGLEGEKKMWEEKHGATVASLQSTQETLQSTLKELELASTERGEWQNKHHGVTESLQSSEKQLQSTLAELNATLASLDALRTEEGGEERENGAEMSSRGGPGQIAAANETLENERAKHQTLVDSLKQEIESQKTTIATHQTSISDLEQMCEEAKTHSEKEGSSARDELASYTARVAELTAELETHKATVETQKTELSSLQSSHGDALKEMETRMVASGDAQLESRLTEKDAQHEQAVDDLRAEVSNSKKELTQLLETVTGLLNPSSPVTVHNIHDQLQDVLAQKQHFSDKYSELMDTNENLLKELDIKRESHDKLEKQAGESGDKAAQHEAQIDELARLVADHEETVKAKEELVKQKEAMIAELTVEKDKSVRLVEELEDQITNTFDQHHNRLSVIQQERTQALDDANGKIVQYEKDMEQYRARIDQLEGNVRPSSPDGQQSVERTSSMNSNLRKSASATSLPSPPPAIPLPPLPNIAATANAPNAPNNANSNNANSNSNANNNNNNTNSTSSGGGGGGGSASPPPSRHTSKELVNAQLVEDQEARIRTIEKHLHAEKQLTATLEEALGDLEAQSNKVKTDMESWKKKAWQLEEELNTLRSERKSARQSVQQMEEERNARREAEAARAHLEEKMNGMSKKKKKSTLNCF